MLVIPPLISKVISKYKYGGFVRLDRLGAKVSVRLPPLTLKLLPPLLFNMLPLESILDEILSPFLTSSHSILLPFGLQSAYSVFA